MKELELRVQDSIFVVAALCFSGDGGFSFEARFLCGVLAVLELTLHTRLVSNSENPPASASSIKGVCHYFWALFFF